MHEQDRAAWERRLVELTAEIEALKARADIANHRTTEGEVRADVERGRTDALEARADAANDRADASELRADESDVRADKAESRADAQDTKLGDVESRLDVDEALLAELQAEGLVDREQADHLKEALRSARLIGAATGMVMAERHCTQTGAFAILSKASQNSNRKLRVIADDLVRSGDTSGLPRV